MDSKTYHAVQNDETTDTARKFFDAVVETGASAGMIIWGGNYFTDFLPPSRGWIVWDKENTGNFADAELAWTDFDKSVRLYKFLWNGMSREGNRATEGKTRSHPTQKPVGLHVEIIKEWATGEAPVLDGFLGSGTTLLACEKLGRRCRAIEISPGYVAVALQRWADMTGKQPELLK